MQAKVRYIPAFFLIKLHSSDRYENQGAFKQFFLPYLFDGTDLAHRVLGAPTV